jgi:hypothetical protein
LPPGKSVNPTAAHEINLDSIVTHTFSAGQDARLYVSQDG